MALPGNRWRRRVHRCLALPTCRGDGKRFSNRSNTRFLAAPDYPWLEVRTHDVITDPLPAAQFDLVHTRLVLTHLPEGERVLKKMSDAVKPGGWILVEEPDFAVEAIAPDVEERLINLWTHGMRVVGLVQRQRGMDVTLGQRLWYGAQFGIYLSGERRADVHVRRRFACC